MSAQNCYEIIRAGKTCIYCEAVDAIEGSPAFTLEHPVQGWTAGARSQSEIALSDLRTVFSVGQAAGIVIGLVSAGAFDAEAPETIQFGLYLWTQGGILLAQVYESGAAAGAVFQRAHDDTFQIIRRGDQVSYLVNGDVVYVSAGRSVGGVVVGCCLYLTGDAVL